MAEDFLGLLNQLKQQGLPVDELTTAAEASAPVRLTPDQQQTYRQFLRSFDTDTPRALLKRAALVRTFDEDLFAKALALPQEAVSFSEFTARPEIERLPRSQDDYRLKDQERKRYWDAWQEDDAVAFQAPDSNFRKYSRQLADYYKSREGEEGLDYFLHSLAADPAVATKWFDAHYEKADHAFNLPRCFTLLRMLDDRSGILSPKLVAARQQRRAYFEARSLFAEEYYQAAYYYRREAVLASLERVLADKTKWVFNLFAAGGMGKTMFLRWLVARVLVPEPRRVPCARVDLDFLNLRALHAYPWLVLLLFAEQLSKQIAATPFYELLKEHGHFVAVLHRMQTDRPDPTLAEMEQVLQVRGGYLRDDVCSRFQAAVSEARLGKRIVLILDTLEEALLTRPATVGEVLEALRPIHQACPDVKLLLAGRYDLRGFKKAFTTSDDETESFELTPFTRLEAHGYLTSMRGLSAQHPLEAIIDRADGNPFKLTLYAELALTSESLTEAEVRGWAGADYAHLIERIILRVKEEPLRRLLRYGVIPRRLTLAFVEKVMAEHLWREMAAPDLDHPKELWPPEAAVYEGRDDIWRQVEPTEKRDLTALWGRLKDYASSHGWVAFGAGDVPRFQPDFVNPMRRLLQPHPVSQALHREAAAFFRAEAAQAEDDPERWAVLTCEVIYHTFQRDGPAAADFWQRLFKQKPALRSPAARKLLAEEILREEYAEDKRKPLTRLDGAPLIDLSVLAEAHVGVARATIVLAQQSSPSDALWTEARAALHHAEALQAELGRPVVPAVLPALLNARQLADDRQYDAAFARLEEALKAAETDEDRLTLELELARLFARLKRPDAVRHYEAALDLQQRNGFLDRPTHQIRTEFAQYYSGMGDAVAAQRQHELALGEARGDPAAELEINIHLAESHMYAGQLADATQRLADAEKLLSSETRKQHFWVFHSLAQLALLRYEPLRALARLEEAAPEAADLESKAAVCELRGGILARLMDFRRAAEQLEQAESMLGEMGYLAGPERCRRQRVELHLYGTGDFREAGRLLQERERLQLLTGTEMWLRRELLELDYLCQTDETAEAARRWRVLPGQSWVASVPRQLFLTLLHGIALRLSDDEDAHARQLMDVLGQIGPPTARLHLLKPLRLLRSPHGIRSAPRDKLALLPAPPRKQSDDYVPYVLLQSEALCFFGARELAQAFLEQSLRDGLFEKRSYASWELLRLDGRWNLRLARDLVSSAFFEEYQSYPVLCAAARVEQAERALAGQNVRATNHHNDHVGETFDFVHNVRTAQLHANAARAALERESGLGSQWHARTEALFARLARAEGDTARSERHDRQALALYERLQDAAAARSLRRALDEKVTVHLKTEGVEDDTVMPRGESSFLRMEDTLQIRLRVVGSPPAIQTVFDAGKPDLRGTARYEHPLVAELVARFSLPSSPQQIETVARLFGQDTTAQQLRRVPQSSFEQWLQNDVLRAPLFNWLLSRAAAGKPVDLRFEIADDLLAAIPWEFLWLTDTERPLSLAPFMGCFYRALDYGYEPREEMAWVRSALERVLAGRSGKTEVPRQVKDLRHELSKQQRFSVTAETKAKLVEALRLLGPGAPLRVLVLQPSSERQNISQRGLDVSGVRLAEVYRYGRISVEVLDNPTLVQLADVLRGFGPHVVHICSTLRQMSLTGEVYLDFAARGRTELLSASTLSQLLQLLPDDRPRPLLILDVPRPPGETEAFRQLLLRNRLATDLFRVEASGQILATGLAQPNQQALCYNQLVRHLAEGRTPAEIARGVRELQARSSTPLLWRDRLGLLGTALFSVDPHLPLLSLNNA